MQLSVKLLLLSVIGILLSCNERKQTPKQDSRVLPFYTTADFTPRWIMRSSTSYDSIHTIPSFQFINQYGKTVTEKTFAGKIYVSDFFFTACPGICKRLTTNLSLVQTAFKNDSDVLILSHTVTPENDSVARLKQYALSFRIDSAKWNLVTGNRNEIYTIARQAYFADEDMGAKKNVNDFLHTENILLIDKHRRIRGVYKGTSVKEVQDLIGDIKTLKEEE